jgi:uncharacterized membrane protein
MPQRAWFRSLQRSFVTGIILLAPVSATLWVINLLLATLNPVTTLVIDFLLTALRQPVPVPPATAGVVVVVTGNLITVTVLVGIILMVGWLSRTVLGSVVAMIGDFIARLPVLGLVYSSVRDLVNAVSGKEKRFQHPVWVKPISNSPLRFIGFITREDLAMLGAKGDVAVYLPHSYNISGNLIIVPRRVVRPIKTQSADLFAFVATGGMSGAHGHHGGRGR